MQLWSCWAISLFLCRSLGLSTRGCCLKTRLFCSMAEGKGNSPLDDVSAVEIDEGRFKYILIKVHETAKDRENFKYIVRGYKWAEYHANIYEQVDAKMKKSLEAECVGGGRILHEPDKQSIMVYGYSQQYGRADHEITTELLKKHYPHYSNITWTDEGY